MRPVFVVFVQPVLLGDPAMGHTATRVAAGEEYELSAGDHGIHISAPWPIGGPPVTWSVHVPYVNIRQVTWRAV